MPNILVLGATGMLGRTVYQYLSREFPKNTWGTDRTSQGFFKLEASAPQSYFLSIQKKLGQIDYVINCIGLLKNIPQKIEKDYEIINSLFPKKLAKLAEKYHFKIIHVSTDAVYSPLSGRVCEKDMPAPIGMYEESKYAGEIESKIVLNVRTSLLGLDPVNKKGLLEWALKNWDNSINGYYNQIWTGCTTLQFAEFCKNIIAQNTFEVLNQNSSVYHFAPLQSSKYDIIKTLLSLSDKPFMIKKTKGPQITRTLYSAYSSIFCLHKYSNNLKTALKEIIKFDKRSI